MAGLYPLRFRPILRHYLWGGRRLVDMFGKVDGGQPIVAESWEVCDRGDDQSVVEFGPLTGRTLGELAAEFGGELYGSTERPPRFPLLFKLLDARQPLSVQVHPNDEQAAKLCPPDLGKTEAWVVLAAEPGSVIYAGLKRGFDRAALAREVARGTTELCLHRFEPRVGDCIFIPAGTLHALGGGIVVAEIQQASDTTFRLFDWNRVGQDGKPRTLHVEQALGVIDEQRGPVFPQTPRPTGEAGVEALVACDKFVLDRRTIESAHVLHTDARPRIVAVLAGSIRIDGDPGDQALKRGDTALIPASCDGVALHPLAPTQLLTASMT
ncbi:MAG: type I phosphomannose isomerase catalytic subunit [Pirellulales bacterium]